MLIGYATSTVEQEAGFEAQKRDLEAVGVEKVFAEQVSSVAEREKLAQALDFIREGDVLVVTKLDRLARSMRDLMEIVDRIKSKGASLRILNMGMDTTTPTGELILNVLGSVASSSAPSCWRGSARGSPRRRSKASTGAASPPRRRRPPRCWRCTAGLGATDIAKQLKIGRSSVYRAITAA